MVITKITYLDIIKCAENFISLDISVNSTGWVKWLDGKLYMGIYSIKSVKDIDRKFEFKKFLKDLFGDAHFKYCFIEDVFGGTNFNTVKSLLQLNTLVDDLKYEGIVNIDEIKREGNGVWKRHLKVLSGYEPTLHGELDKAMITACLKELDFDTKTINSYLSEKIASKSYQDICDAMGIALGVIKRDILDVRSSIKFAKKVKADLRKGYNVIQYSDEFDALDEANSVAEKTGKEIKSVDLRNKSRDLQYNFKKVAEEFGDELLYVITVETCKIGALALEKGFNLSLPVSYLLCYRKR